MKSPHATTTPDLLPDHDLAGERPPRRSRGDKMRAARGLKAITVNLPAELVDKFHAKRKRQVKTANAVIERLIETQYLRDR